MKAADTSTSSRPRIRRIAEPRPAVSEDVLLRLVQEISHLFEMRTFAGTVEIEIDDAKRLLIDGDARTVEAGQGGTSTTRTYIHPLNLDRLIRGEMDPRHGLLFGHIELFAGSARTLIAFGDFLSGRRVLTRLDTDSAFPQPTRDWTQAQDDLQTFGYALVEGAMSPDLVTRLRERVIEQAAAELEAGVAPMKKDSTTHQIWNLINKGAVFHELLLNPVIERFVPRMLGDHAVLTSYSVGIAMPGNAVTFMHYDQSYVQPPVNAFPFGLNILWFLDDVTDANGGTRVMPGSHRAGIAPSDVYSIEDTVAAQGPAGTALLLDSRCWHSIGPNSTNGRRHVVISYFNRSFMRTQENYFLSVPDDIVATLDDRIKVMLGYRCTGSLGGVEGPIEGQMVSRPKAPVMALKPSGRAGLSAH